MPTKQKAIASLNALPEEDFKDLDVLLEKIILLERIEKAENDILAGKTYNTSEAKKKLKTL